MSRSPLVLNSRIKKNQIPIGNVVQLQNIVAKKPRILIWIYTKKLNVAID